MYSANGKVRDYICDGAKTDAKAMDKSEAGTGSCWMTGAGGGGGTMYTCDADVCERETWLAGVENGNAQYPANIMGCGTYVRRGVI